MNTFIGTMNRLQKRTKSKREKMQKNIFQEPWTYRTYRRVVANLGHV